MQRRRFYDVWFSDSNDRSLIGVVDVRCRGSVEHDSWYALDKAIAEYSKAGVEWERPFGDAAATCEYHGKYCGCVCHDHEEGCEWGNDTAEGECTCGIEGNEGGCEDCCIPNTINVEPCGGHSHYAQHGCVREKCLSENCLAY